MPVPISPGQNANSRLPVVQLGSWNTWYEFQPLHEEARRKALPGLLVSAEQFKQTAESFDAYPGIADRQG